MRVLFISANTEQINMPTLPLGLGCVAQATQQAGHDVELVDLMFRDDTGLVLKDAIEGFRPDIIGMSVRNIDDQNRENPTFLLEPVKEIISDCRGLSDVPIVLGGAGYSIFPESALIYLGADMGIQGEGEVAFPVLLEMLKQGADLSRLPCLYLPQHSLQGERIFAKNLDTLPLPDAHLWSPSTLKDHELWMPVQTRRGCPLNCSYCSTSTIEGRIIRRHSPKVVTEWITQLVEARSFQFFFVDNTFNLPPWYAKEICRKLIDTRLDISWWCIIYPKDVDEELVKLMARAGCKQVSLGFESGSEKILKNMNKRFKPEKVRQISEMLTEHGIRRIGFLLLGGPGETKETVDESLAFADSLNLDGLKVTVGIRIYPNTLLAKTAIEESVIEPQNDLLFPRFYLTRGLEDWLPERSKEYRLTRPWVF